MDQLPVGSLHSYICLHVFLLLLLLQNKVSYSSSTFFDAKKIPDKSMHLLKFERVSIIVKYIRYKFGAYFALGNENDHLRYAFI